jgi:hypothetical protein
VDPMGVEPMIFRMRTGCSATELQAPALKNLLSLFKDQNLSPLIRFGLI